MAEDADAHAAPADTAAATPLPVVIAGRYALHERLGWGSFSEVWSATDRVLGRKVAVKRLLPHLLDDPRSAERFRREAIALARVNHPGVIAVFDTVATPDCQAIIMELVEGESLRSHFDAVGMLDPGDVIDIGIALFDALGAAHRQGLVHRDVTATNILIGEDSAIRLTDFGLAQFAEHTQTLTGSITGTAPYVAPEQVEGGPVDQRSDIYSASVVLFEAACGQPPFVRSTDAATMLARLHEAPPDPRSLRPALPVDVTQVILRGLARNPDDRHADASQAAADLRAASVAMQRLPTPSTLASLPVPSRARRSGGSTGSAQSSSVVTVQSRPSPAAPPRRAAPSARPIRDVRHSSIVIDPPPPPKQPSPARAPRSAGRRGVAIAVTLLIAGASLVVVALVQPTDGSPSIPSTTTAPTGPVSFTGVTTLDPEGTGTPGENDQLANRLIDGDPNSSWITERYLDQRFGTKPGVGFGITLTGDTAMVDMTISSRSEGWRAEVSVVNQLPKGVPAPGRVIEGGAGSTTVDLRGMQGSAIVVWITRLGLGSGGYSVEWTEIQATGRV